jgi:hypothetical protein
LLGQHKTWVNEIGEGSFINDLLSKQTEPKTKSSKTMFLG